MSLSIAEFASISLLPTQTLRHYHAEGLLVPAEVDERTGYRSYSYDQIHRAVLIAALRGAQVAVRDVRAALNAPDSLPTMLGEHAATLGRQREREDAALEQAHLLVDGWPVVIERHTSPTTVVTTRVPGQVLADDGQVLPAAVRDAVVELARGLDAVGISASGVSWCGYALENPSDKAKVQSPEGPDWLCAVPVQGDADLLALPASATTGAVGAGSELVVSFAAAPTMATLSAVFDQMMRHAEDQELVPEIARPRYLLHPDRVEIAVPYRPLRDLDDDPAAR